MADNDVDYYELLGLDLTASIKEINTAYRQKSLKVHPDRVRRFSLLTLRYSFSFLTP
jgi:curved DNA-binding protein CbpA